MIKKKCKECGTLIDLHAQEYCEICHGNYGWWYTCDKHEEIILRDEVKECPVCNAKAHSAVKPSDVPPVKTKKTTPLTPSSRERSTKILPWAAGLVLATLGIYWLGQNHQDQAEPAVTQNDPTSEPAPEPTPEPAPEPTPEPTPSSIYFLAKDHYDKSQYADAFGYFRDASEQGHAESQVYLGFMYENGKGVPKNDTEAFKWYRKAAEQRNAFGQYNLGFMYNTGRGVPENDAEAVKWYRKAAEQGHAFGQSALGYMYYNGHGVSKDEIQGYKWTNLAAAQGNEGAKKNKEIYSNNMIRSDIEEAQKLSSQFKPRKDSP